MTRTPALLVLLMACKPYDPVFGGSPVWQMFPFDGVRTWEYISVDTELSYKLVATSLGEPEVLAGTNIYNVEYSTHCVTTDPECVEDEVIRKVKWSSTVTDGAYIHAYDAGDGFVDLVPGVRLTYDDMSKDDVIETVVGNVTWTSTMLGIEQCPVTLSADWDECGAFLLEVSEGDGYPIAGTYWATVGNGVAALEIVTESQWQLSDISCEGECDGSW